MAARRSGQSTVEYMMTISVISIAIVAVLMVFSNSIMIGTQTLSDYLAVSLSSSDQGGDGVQ